MALHAVPPLDPLDDLPASVRAIPASARIHALLRERIVGMRLLPGAPLSEKEITETMGVSRTPVREAFLRLAEERLVDVYPQYGTFVSRIRPDALRDAMAIRGALERVTVREAAVRSSEAGVAGLTRLLELQRAADRTSEIATFHIHDEAFHQAIALMAEHPNLWRVVRQEKTQMDRCRMLTLPIAGRRRRVVEQHAAVTDAIGRGDPDAAEAAMDAHLADVLPSFEAVRERHPDYFEDGAANAARPRRAAGARS